MTFTKNRHYVSTMYACRKLPAQERDKFYDHMRHSRDMNKQRYQCPLAISLKLESVFTKLIKKVFICQICYHL